MSLARFRFLPVLLTLGAVLWGAVAARAQAVAQAVHDFDALVRNYNLVSFGNASFTGNYGDTHGPLAVQGNLTVHGGSIGDQPTRYGPTSDPVLFVGGTLTMSGTTQLGTGYASISSANNASGSWDGGQRRLTTGGGILSTSNSSNPLAANDPRTNAGPSNWNWQTLQGQAQAVSNTLAAAALNGTVQINGQTLTLVASSGAAGVVVFNLDASQLIGNTYNGQMFSSIQFNVPSDQVFVVNVTNLAQNQTLFGTGSGINFNNGSGYERLLWNLLPADGSVTDVRLGNGGEFYGSVLAPTLNLSNAGNTAVNGQIVAASYSHSGAELHQTSFDASGIAFSAVPEPSTYALAGVGLCAVAAIWHQRRRRAQS